MRIEDVRAARSPLDVLRDARGRMLVVYHGTATLFDQLRPSTDGAYGPGVYFTTHRRGAWHHARAGFLGTPRLIAATITMLRPFRDGVDTIPGVIWPRTEVVMAHGYDGIIAESETIEGLEGELMLVVPRASQVRTLR